MRSKKAIINISTSLILQIVTIISGFIIPRLIMSKFGSDVNGLVTSITQFLAYITLLESGFGPVVKSVLYKPIANNDIDKIKRILKASDRFFKKISYIFISYIIVLCIIYPFMVQKQFSVMYTWPLVVIISISIFSEYYFGMTYGLFLQSKQKTYIVSIIRTGTVVLNTIITIILVKLNCDIHLIKLFNALILTIRPILQNLYVKKKYNINLKEVENDYVIEQKWDGLAQHIAYVIHSNTDIVLLTLFSTTTEISVYSVYLLVVNGIKSLVQGFLGGVDASFGDMIAKNENETLNKAYSRFELCYFSIITIIFITTLLLIVPFVSIYTNNITDANYIRPLFAYLMVISEFIWAIRQPYNELIKASGSFKETKKGAWVEAITNFVISIILIKKMGIVGVAIGTLIAMFIRTIELIYYTSTKILKRNVKISIKKILVIIFEFVLVIFISKFILNFKITSYLTWIIQAMIMFIISTIVVLMINWMLYKNETLEIFKMLKLFKRRKSV